MHIGHNMKVVADLKDEQALGLFTVLQSVKLEDTYWNADDEEYILSSKCVEAGHPLLAVKKNQWVEVEHIDRSDTTYGTYLDWSENPRNVGRVTNATVYARFDIVDINKGEHVCECSTFRSLKPWELSSLNNYRRDAAAEHNDASIGVPEFSQYIPHAPVTVSHLPKEFHGNVVVSRSDRREWEFFGNLRKLFARLLMNTPETANIAKDAGVTDAFVKRQVYWAAAA